MRPTDVTSPRGIGSFALNPRSISGQLQAIPYEQMELFAEQSIRPTV